MKFIKLTFALIIALSSNISAKSNYDDLSKKEKIKYMDYANLIKFSYDHQWFGTINGLKDFYRMLTFEEVKNLLKKEKNNLKIKKISLIKGTIYTTINYKKTGLDFSIFEDKNNRYYLAFDGTDPTSIKDIGSDIKRALLFKSEQDKKAKIIFTELLSNTNKEIMILGHSLGGGLVEYIFASTELPSRVSGITINSAGINQFIDHDIEKNKLKKQYKKLTQIVNKYEIVSLTTSAPSTETIEIDNTINTGVFYHIIKNNTFAKHTIDNVCQRMTNSYAFSVSKNNQKNKYAINDIKTEKTSSGNDIYWRIEVGIYQDIEKILKEVKDWDSLMKHDPEIEKSTKEKDLLFEDKNKYNASDHTTYCVSNFETIQKSKEGYYNEIKRLDEVNYYFSIKHFIKWGLPNAAGINLEYLEKVNTAWVDELCDINRKMVSALKNVNDTKSASDAVEELDVLSELMGMKKSSGNLGIGNMREYEIKIRKFVNLKIKNELKSLEEEKIRLLKLKYYDSPNLKEMLKTGGKLNTLKLYSDDYMQKDSIF